MKKFRTVLSLALLALLVVFPVLFPEPEITTIAVFSLLFVGAATAWNLFSGYTGYISLGHAVFYGIGAYTLAILCQDWQIPGGYTQFLLLPLTGLIASIVAVPLGWLTLRVRRHLFVVVTLAVFNVFQLLAYNFPGITNGSNGMFLPAPPWNAVFYNIPFYYVALLLCLISFGVSWWIRHSKYGLGLLAIRDDEDRAVSLGVKAGIYKLSAYVISAFFVGMAGAMGVYFIGTVYPPTAFTPVFDVTVALMSLLGGLGTLIGPIIGALLIEPLQQFLTVQLGLTGLDLILFGTLLLAVVLMMPQGITPAVSRGWIKQMIFGRPPVDLAPAEDEKILVTKGGKDSSIML